MRYPQWSAVVSCVVVLLVAAEVQAFDGQVALGGGLGVGSYDQAEMAGPMASLYGAYGLSDSFDARLELGSALLKPDTSSTRSPLSSALAFCTYKLDVIQWIPWGGLGVGVHQLAGELKGESRNSVEFGVSALLGFDYAWSRNDGLSLAFGLHAMPLAEDGSPATLRYLTVALRYEHRWGW